MWTPATCAPIAVTWAASTCAGNGDGGAVASWRRGTREPPPLCWLQQQPQHAACAARSKRSFRHCTQRAEQQHRRSARQRERCARDSFISKPASDPMFELRIRSTALSITAMCYRECMCVVASTNLCFIGACVHKAAVHYLRPPFRVHGLPVQCPPCLVSSKGPGGALGTRQPWLLSLFYPCLSTPAILPILILARAAMPCAAFVIFSAPKSEQKAIQ